MPRRALLASLWLAAAGIAVLIAMQGVNAVSRQALQSEPSDLVLDTPEFATTRAPTSTGTTIPSTATQQLAQDAPGDDTSSSDPEQTPTPSTDTTAPTITTTAPSISTTPPSANPSTNTTNAPGPITKTFNLIGGTTAISFSPDEIKVLYANPNPGYYAEIEPEGLGLKVEFESETHRSRVEAWWADGPQHETREREN